MLWLVLMLFAFGIAASGRKALGYIAGEPVELELVSIGGGFQLAARAAQAFLAMRAAAEASGVALKVNSAFRTMEEQWALHDAYLRGERPVAASPGYSNHQGGIAVDLETANGTNAAFRWLTTHAAEFGFAPTVQSEPWHWEYRA